MTSTRVSVIATFKSFSYGVRGVPFFFSKKCRTRWPDSPAPPEGKSLVFSLFLRVWWRDVVVHQRREGREKLKEASRSQKLIKSISVEMDLENWRWVTLAKSQRAKSGLLLCHRCAERLCREMGTREIRGRKLTLGDCALYLAICVFFTRHLFFSLHFDWRLIFPSEVVNKKVFKRIQKWWR